MLDQETGLRGYLLTGREAFLDPYASGEREFDAALKTSRAEAAGDPEAQTQIDAQEKTARTWQALAEHQLALGRAPGFGARSIKKALERKLYMDRFRKQNTTFQRLVEARRANEVKDAGDLVVAIILGLGLGFGALGTLLIRRARVRRGREREFAETLQIMRSEKEARALLGDHLERAIKGGRVTVLTRNNSADRLEASTELADDDPLHDPLEHARPQSCLAVRLAHPHSRSGKAEPLLPCDLCGKSVGGSRCQPLIVGGEVLGSVLLRTRGAPTPADSERLDQAVSRAAPALANLRNLALAEARAQTDPLTGLPNKRAIAETVKRMHAYAMRVASPLSVLIVDLDHFKRVNDTYGHSRGDDALAATADTMSASVRESDFVGRMGGEEFIVLLPDTPNDAAVLVAQKLRQAIEVLDVPGVPAGLTASVGIATYPDDAAESDAVLRLADRALYLAKKLGRNRVERVTGDVVAPSAE
jgi:diguanylate cyclase (GGDEF)-like protein